MDVTLTNAQSWLLGNIVLWVVSLWLPLSNTKSMALQPCTLLLCTLGVTTHTHTHTHTHTLYIHNIECLTGFEQCREKGLEFQWATLHPESSPITQNTQTHTICIYNNFIELQNNTQGAPKRKKSNNFPTNNSKPCLTQWKPEDPKCIEVRRTRSVVYTLLRLSRLQSKNLT